MDSESTGPVVGPRVGPIRDCRGRGVRGVAPLPGPLSPRGAPSRRTPRDEFERLVAGIVDALQPTFRAESRAVEVVVEDAPDLPTAWDDPVPTALVNVHGDVTRIVLFRLPITRRAHDRDAVDDFTWTVLLGRLAEVWQVDPDDLDPRR